MRGRPAYHRVRCPDQHVFDLFLDAITGQCRLDRAHDEAWTSRGLTDADRQSVAMGWVRLALGTFLLLGGLALWAAVFGAGFGGLIGVAAMGVVMAATIVAVSYCAIRLCRSAREHARDHVLSLIAVVTGEIAVRCGRRAVATTIVRPTIRAK